MTAPFHILGREDAEILIIADHASNHVPADIDLGIDPIYLNDHIAIDIGVSELAAHIVADADCCAILAGVSRLVIDYNREIGHESLVPVESDGIAIPGNSHADVGHRIGRFYDPYHIQLEALAGQAHKPFLFSIHSFTPSLRSRPGLERPWEIGVLYGQDERVAPIAIAALRKLGYIVGDQLPYSGKILNATMNRHAEAHRRQYLGVEVRQDLVMTPGGQKRIADDLLIVVRKVRKTLQEIAG